MGGEGKGDRDEKIPSGVRVWWSDGVVWGRVKWCDVVRCDVVLGGCGREGRIQETK